MSNSRQILDLLPITPTGRSFVQRVQALGLSRDLQNKVLQQPGVGSAPTVPGCQILSKNNEQELALEMLLHRHRFSELLLGTPYGRQAAVTVIQNIYLFQQRRIFFAPLPTSGPDSERQEALRLFSSPATQDLPLAKTLQHSIIARIWRRLDSNRQQIDPKTYRQLLLAVEDLNTLRNIYMLLARKLVTSLLRRINPLYRQSLGSEDMHQAAILGVGRAAYRFYPQNGSRFSTYAWGWIHKEVQRQALGGRLIKLSAATIQAYSEAQQRTNTIEIDRLGRQLALATPLHQEKLSQDVSPIAVSDGVGAGLEKREAHSLLLRSIEQVLSSKSGDIIKRRYGLPPYHQEGPQSVIAISKLYGVTRGSIYQQESAALAKLRQHLSAAFV